MVALMSTAIGGLLGAIIGVAWGDPYRNRRGRYTTRTRGFQSWAFQAITGAFIGAALTSVIIPLLVVEPLIGFGAFLLVCYGIYVWAVDPR